MTLKLLYYDTSTVVLEQGMMDVQVDMESATPVFRQLAEQVKAAVARGAIRPGEAIPSVRQMAGIALVNPNTVTKAYRELEYEGVIYTRRGLGVFVAEDAVEKCTSGRREELRKRLNEIAVEARQAGISLEELRGMLDQAITETEEE